MYNDNGKVSTDAVGIPEVDREDILTQWTSSFPSILHHSLAPTTALANRFEDELHAELCMVIQAEPGIVLVHGSAAGRVAAMQKLFQCVVSILFAHFHVASQSASRECCKVFQPPVIQQ